MYSSQKQLASLGRPQTPQFPVTIIRCSLCTPKKKKWRNECTFLIAGAWHHRRWDTRFDSLPWNWGTPNIRRTRRIPLQLKISTNHTSVITITANSLPLVITIRARTRQPVGFRSALTGGPSAAVFRPDWFNSSHSLIYTSSGPTLSLASHHPLPHLLLPLAAASPGFCVSAMPLKVRRAECSDRTEILHGPCPFMGSWRGDGGAGRCEEGRRRSRDDIYVWGNLEIEFARVQAQSEYTLRPIPRLSHPGTIRSFIASANKVLFSPVSICSEETPLDF